MSQEQYQVGKVLAHVSLSLEKAENEMGDGNDNVSRSPPLFLPPVFHHITVSL